jgi:inositol hexakisphosphate/diphosphoinositol-pentakisphosphate kinase
VKKDAGMLDAFGKGASADIQLAKQELYAQVGGLPCLHFLPA